MHILIVFFCELMLDCCIAYWVNLCWFVYSLIFTHMERNMQTTIADLQNAQFLAILGFNHFVLADLEQV